MYSDVSMGKPETNEDEYSYDRQQQFKEGTQRSSDLKKNGSTLYMIVTIQLGAGMECIPIHKLLWFSTFYSTACKCES